MSLLHFAHTHTHKINLGGLFAKPTGHAMCTQKRGARERKRANGMGAHVETMRCACACTSFTRKRPNLSGNKNDPTKTRARPADVRLSHSMRPGKRVRNTHTHTQTRESAHALGCHHTIKRKKIAQYKREKHTRARQVRDNAGAQSRVHLHSTHSVQQLIIDFNNIALNHQKCQSSGSMGRRLNTIRQ